MKSEKNFHKFTTPGIFKILNFSSLFFPSVFFITLELKGIVADWERRNREHITQHANWYCQRFETYSIKKPALEVTWPCDFSRIWCVFMIWDRFNHKMEILLQLQDVLIKRLHQSRLTRKARKKTFYGFMGEYEDGFLNEWKSFVARFPIMQINFIITTFFLSLFADGKEKKKMKRLRSKCVHQISNQQLLFCPEKKNKKYENCQ